MTNISTATPAALRQALRNDGPDGPDGHLGSDCMEFTFENLS